MPIDPHFRPAGSADLHAAADGLHRAGALDLTPEHLAVERAIRGLKAASPARRHTIFAQIPAADVTVTSVLRKFADLHEAVAVFARSLRSQGVPPERMLTKVKITVTDVILIEGWRDRAVEQLVLENVVRWSIEAYYSD